MKATQTTTPTNTQLSTTTPTNTSTALGLNGDTDE